MENFALSVIVGVATGIYSSLITLNYSQFSECKNRLTDAIRQAHTQIFVLSSPDHDRILHELFATFDVICERLHSSGHIKAVEQLGEVKTDILTLKSLIAHNGIQSLEIADRFIKWLAVVNSLPSNTLAFFKPRSS